jgi:hypothetical protein
LTPRDRERILRTCPAAPTQPGGGRCDRRFQR